MLNPLDTFTTQWPHHAFVQVGLDDIRVHVLHVQNMEFCFHTIQNALAVKHSLLEVSGLLEKLEFCGHLSKFPLFGEIRKNKQFRAQ